MHFTGITAIIKVILEWIGLACILVTLYVLSQSAWEAYSQQYNLQIDNQWLYNHCMQNEKLKEVTDACDTVLLLFQVTPLQVYAYLVTSFEHMPYTDNITPI